MIERLLKDPPLHPSPDEGRSLLRRELLKPEYNDANIIDRLMRKLQELLEDSVNAASDASPLSSFAAIVTFVLLVLGLGWLISRARGSARAAKAEGPVFTDEQVSAKELRRRAELALGEGRHELAVVDGFRALAVRQVERGRLADNPGATADEVAGSLAELFPPHRPRVDASAQLFDAVLYGDRPATRDQAVSVLELDDELGGR